MNNRRRECKDVYIFVLEQVERSEEEKSEELGHPQLPPQPITARGYDGNGVGGEEISAGVFRPPL